MSEQTDQAPLEYIDYILMKEVYHCTPSDLDEQEEWLLNLHREFMGKESKWHKIKTERDKQRAAQK